MELKLPPTLDAGETLTGAEIVIRCLKAEGVEYVFGYPGAPYCTSTTRSSSRRT